MQSQLLFAVELVGEQHAASTSRQLSAQETPSPLTRKWAWDLIADNRVHPSSQHSIAGQHPDYSINSLGSSVVSFTQKLDGFKSGDPVGNHSLRNLEAARHLTRGLSATAASLSSSIISSVQRFAVGDDHSLQDHWRATSSTRMTIKAAEQHDVLQRRPSMLADEASRSFKTLLWYYLQTFFYSIAVAFPVFPVVWLLSMVHWHVDNHDPYDKQVFLPNRTAIQWALFMQCFFSLALYGVVLYMATMRTFHVPLPLVFMTAGTVSISLLATALFWHYDVSVWYHYLDLVMICTVYVPSLCTVGWLSAGVDATLQHRIQEVLFVALLEGLVAVSTLIYTTFLMPLFYTFKNAWLQMLWLCVLHPLYFEVTTAAIVRKALHRNVTLGRTDVVHFLPIVHATVHMVALNITLQASIEPLRIIALSALLFNVGKLAWRSTVLYRDLFMERLLRHNWSFCYNVEERAVLCQLISVSVLTELILENAAIMTAPFMMWAMYKEPIFMSVVPNTYFSNDGKYPIYAMFLMVSIMFAITWFGDIVFFVLNYYSGQKLPIIYTWRKIKDGKWAYIGFLTYALTTMGVMFSFSMMLILPRAAYCGSDNYCDCKLVTYQAICRGEYISMQVDYLI